MDKKTVSSKPKKSGRSAKKAAIKNEDLKNYINKILEDTKSLDITIIDLEGKSSIADYMVVATGTSDRHVSHIAEEVRDKIKEKYDLNCKLEGLDVGDWVVIDAIDVIVHVFKPEVREFYNLEKLWGSDFSDTSFTLYTK